MSDSPSASPAPPPADASRERIIAAATSLFADHGYDGTSTRRIAAEAGLNMATVAYHVGGKPDLYREVMLRAHLAEQRVLTDALAAFRELAPTDPAAAVTGLVDRYLDFCLDQPHIPALWMRRWLSDAAEFADLEAAYARPLVDAVRDTVREVVPSAPRAGSAEPADVEMTVWTVLWSTHGFCRSGIRAEVPRFRAHLRALVLRELGLAAPHPRDRERG
ncbi:TetR/AcrR family transcriptional regulator [Streptomyces sp. NBC_00328]|uniref:TetR/AcrR family transcriptional regulator n=1 Tax=Streptomyces sp. NBC_00328 TaxID=2903646 RepID=UPI002E2D2A05|nr:TetR family transcriptional regulator [Streptomyces sp. NBC_00328]